MTTFLHWDEIRKNLTIEGPSAILSLLVTEMFYKFHSFTLECLAFFVTWWLLSGFFSRLPLTLKGSGD